MNVYEKLNEARIKLQNAGIKPSGQNKFSGYTYFELSDIVPIVNKLAQELKFTCRVSFKHDRAELDFVDCEDITQRIIFESPMSEAGLKNCHPVQNLGAVETYIRRYLYITAFEITESDVLNGTHNPNDTSSERTGTTRQPAKQPEQVKTPAITQKGDFDKIKLAISSADATGLDKIKLAIPTRLWTPEQLESIGAMLEIRADELLQGVV
jgi:hypothetical protein